MEPAAARFVPASGRSGKDERSLRHVPRIDRLRVLQLVVVHHLRLGAAGKTLLALALARDVVLARTAVVAAGADLAFGQRTDRHGCPPLPWPKPSVYASFTLEPHLSRPSRS